jgi:hypothetical protein
MDQNRSDLEFVARGFNLGQFILSVFWNCIERENTDHKQVQQEDT